MPSPFPGMNPFLEQDDVWQDFHDTFIPFIRDVLVTQVAPNYIVKVEAYLFIHEPSAEQRVLIGHGDVGVARSNGVGAATSEAVATATRRSPARIRVPQVDIEKHLLLEIHDRIDRDLVTVIELLSPSNKKSGADREQYLAKRGSQMRSAAHFVEIDLLRGWDRMPMENAAACDYSVMVSRVEDRPDADYWPLSLHDTLPTIPVPLRSPHADADLDLQAILHRVYDSAGYGHYIYKASPVPPLKNDDAIWAAALIAAHL